MVSAAASADSGSGDGATACRGRSTSVTGLCGSGLVDRKNMNGDTVTLPVELVNLEPEDPNWSCVRCTFLNHPELNVCECCSLERSSELSE